MGVAEISFNIFKGRGAVRALCIPVVLERYRLAGLTGKTVASENGFQLSPHELLSTRSRNPSRECSGWWQKCSAAETAPYCFTETGSATRVVSSTLM